MIARERSEDHVARRDTDGEYARDMEIRRARGSDHSFVVEMARPSHARGHGIGTALIDALAWSLDGHAHALALNVHLLNPTVRLDMRTGFRVAGTGLGWNGIAMSRPLIDQALQAGPPATATSPD